MAQLAAALGRVGVLFS